MGKRAKNRPKWFKKARDKEFARASRGETEAARRFAQHLRRAEQMFNEVRAADERRKNEQAERAILLAAGHDPDPEFTDKIGDWARRALERNVPFGVTLPKYRPLILNSAS